VIDPSKGVHDDDGYPEAVIVLESGNPDDWRCLERDSRTTINII
jgi:hypothetical protein